MYRKARKLTQEELGEYLQIDQSYLGRIERREVNITLLVHGILNVQKKPFLFVNGLGRTSILPKNGFFTSKILSNLHGVAERTNRFRTSNSDGRNDSYMEHLLTARKRPSHKI
ncbi:helix-turn-helix domain-containing protein [Paenibacillus lautus]|uniref:helix-turn-helix domain-containing protein n=1 Tax=Paenibacillus lautus TaxID=1401 RepID=UPI003D2A3C26